MIEQIITRLADRKICDDWKVNEKIVDDVQFYYIGPVCESHRRVKIKKYLITIMKDCEDAGVRKRGQAAFQLYTGQEYLFEKLLAQAVEMTRVNLAEPFSLPGPAESYSQPDIYDPLIAENPRERVDFLFQMLKREIERHAISCASAEFFMSTVSNHFISSRGIDQTYAHTRAYTEYVLLADRNGRRAEFQAMMSERSISDDAFERVLSRTCRSLLDSFDFSPPRSGTFPVLFRYESLPFLFRPFIYHSSAESQLDGLSTFAEGGPILRPEKIKGDCLTLYSDGNLAMRTNSRPFDNDGLPIHKHNIIDSNIFQKRWGSYRHTTQLGIESTGPFTNIMVPAGDVPLETLRRGSEESPVYEIVALSSFEPNGFTGNFSSEIKLAYEWIGDSCRPVKGGSLSGNLFRAFENVQFSRETESFQHYNGPAAIRFEDVSFSGE